MAALSFIKQLELVPMAEDQVQLALRAKSSPVKEQKEQGFVDAGSLVKKLSHVHKSDVLNSTLLAHLTADKKYNRNKDTDKWYEIYINVLGKVGWVVQELQFERYQASGQSFQSNYRHC